MIRKLIRALFGSGYADGGYTHSGSAEHTRMMESWDKRLRPGNGVIHKPQPCRKKLAPGQWWSFCGETDMGQTAPALCTECGGEDRLAE